MKKTFKSFAAILLVFTMVMSLLPIEVMATNCVTVYVTISNKGVFAKDKYDEPIAYREIEVNDLDNDNKITVSDAMLATHDAYSTNGTDDYAIAYGYANRLWGVSTSNLLAFVNNTGFSTSWDNKTIIDGDHIVASVNSDNETYADWYTYFNSTNQKVFVNTEITLTLKGFQGMAGGEPELVANMPIGMWSNGNFSELADKTTNEHGNICLSFNTPGTYYITAGGTVTDEVMNWSSGTISEKDCPIIAPICVIIVTVEKTDAEYVAEDKSALDITYTFGHNINLPKTGKSEKTTIVWGSDSECIDADTGVVTLPAQDTTVTLTATITCNNEYDTEEFIICLPGRLNAAKNILESSPLKPVEYTNATDYGFKYNSEADDTNIITLACEAINDNSINVEIASEFTSDIIDAEGNITYPSDEAKELTLPLKLTFNEQSTDVSVTVAIPKHAQTKTEAIDAMKAALAQYINDPLVLNGNTSLDEVKTTLLLPAGKSSNLYIKWTSDTTSVIANQTSYSKIVSSQNHPSGGYYEVPVIRPGGQDAIITLTAEIACRSTSIDLPAGPWPTNVAERKISFTVKVPALSEIERKTILDGAINDIKIYDKDGATADIANIKDNLYFPSYSGFTTKWSTDIEGIAIPDSGYGKANVTRPTNGADALVGTITLKLTAGDIEETKTFDAKVQAWTEEDLNTAQSKLNQVAEALTFDAIKGSNTYSNAVVSNLFLKRFAGFTDETVSLDHYTKTDTNAWPIAITWEITPDNGTVTYNDRQANNGTGIITPPSTDTRVNLKATINYRTPIADVNAVEKTIGITVISAKTATHLNLMNNIAATYNNTDNTDDWVLLDIGAYAKLFPEQTTKLSDNAKQTYINNVVSMLTTGKTTGGWDATDGDYAKSILALSAIGIDPERLYAVNNNVVLNTCAKLKNMSFSSHYNAPYVLLANEFGNVNLDNTQVSDLVALLKNNQSESGLFGYEWDGQSYTDLDTTASAIAGLAGLYNTNEDAKAVVDKAINGLSAVQTATGSLGNANTDAMVIVGLAAMGINPHTDSRFIKNENSLLDGLLSHKNNSNNGFLYYGEANALATEQGFRALIAAYGVMSSGTATNVYDFSDRALAPGRATGTGTITTPSAPGGNSITVSVTIKSDTGYWLNNKSVRISGTGATVYHALIKALENSGITQVGAANGYVKSMTKGERTLAEFDNGNSSGWMYKVNGELPKAGLTECAVDDGDKIVWFFTNDWSSVPGSFGGGGSSSNNKKTENKNNEVEKKPVFSETTFADVKKDDWHYQSVKYVYENNIMQGTGNGFEPENKMTRAMLVTVLYRMANTKSKENAHTFTDVPSNCWYSDAVAWAASNGIVNGVSENHFAPDENITREQMALIIYRYAKMQGFDVNEASNLENFTDSNSVSDWAVDAIRWANFASLINGTTDTTLSPKDTATRAQVASILMRFCENIAK